MSTRRLSCAAAFVAPALLALLAGCMDSTKSIAPGPDGVACSGNVQSGPVYIRVSYLPDGTPQLSTLDCAIHSGTDVTWIGPDDEPVQFKIRFKAAPPTASGERMFDAEKDGDTYKVRRTLAGAKGTYPYAVMANGKELDPAIIIR